MENVKKVNPVTYTGNPLEILKRNSVSGHRLTLDCIQNPSMSVYAGFYNESGNVGD
jgi:hypothetical protein